MLRNKRHLKGRELQELEVGERLSLTEKIEDKDLMLYLGLTNDSNPLYIQHDYASKTSYGQPVVPTIMLTGIVSAAISKHMPGPGSHVVQQQLHFPKAVYHYGIVEFTLEISKIEEALNQVTIRVSAQDEDGDTVMSGDLVVVPPVKETEDRWTENQIHYGTK